ncbi:trehalase-like domain-containing protein, partial [Acinetobacter baumannii]
SSLELGVIGNGAIAALIDRDATMVWGCFPRLDGDPVFCRLLDDRDDPAAGGYFSIELQGAVKQHQEYIRNSAVLVTRISDAEGNA